MFDIDFDTMSLEDLKRLKRELDKAIANYDDRRKAEARRDLEEKARACGGQNHEAGARRPKVSQSEQSGSGLDRAWPATDLVPGSNRGRDRACRSHHLRSRKAMGRS